MNIANIYIFKFVSLRLIQICIENHTPKTRTFLKFQKTRKILNFSTKINFIFSMNIANIYIFKFVSLRLIQICIENHTPKTRTFLKFQKTRKILNFSTKIFFYF
jgi:hypothetical protein